MISAAKRFASDETGVTAVEYGLVAALVAVVIIVGAKALGSQANTTLNTTATKVKAL